MDKNIPLSALIRIGSKVSGQCFGEVAYNGKTCALGAAYLARFGEMPANSSSTAEVVKALNIPVIVSMQITQLNDARMWNREKIADWLEARGL